MRNLPKTMLTMGQNGLMLADRAILSRLSFDGQLDIDRDEERIMGVLSMAYYAPVPDWVMPKLKNVAAKWNAGKHGMATMLLIQMGLRDFSGDTEALDRLDTAEKAFDAGEIPRGFIHDCKRAAFNPNEPRDARGRWTSGGSSSAAGRPSNNQPSRRSPLFVPAADHPGEDISANPASGNSGLNVDAAVTSLNAAAASDWHGSKGKCATFVENAIQAGGVSVQRNVPAAKDKGPALLGAGFVPVTVDDAHPPQKGDVAVIQPYLGGNQNGHMAMFNGTEWVSDFHQGTDADPYPSHAYRRASPSYTVYRP